MMIGEQRMHCPFCAAQQITSELREIELMSGSANHPALMALECKQCQAHGIKLADYLSWQSDYPTMTAVVDEIDVEVDTVVEDEQALYCPEANLALQKYRLQSDVSHTFYSSEDRLWLAQGEWALMLEKGVADKLAQIFTDTWQTQIRQQMQRDTVDARYEKQLGKENYSRLRFVRSWLESQSEEDRMLMLAFLFAKDPYSREK